MNIIREFLNKLRDHKNSTPDSIETYQVMISEKFNEMLNNIEPTRRIKITIETL
jgi:hypothetical protein